MSPLTSIVAAPGLGVFSVAFIAVGIFFVLSGGWQAVGGAALAWIGTLALALAIKIVTSIGQKP
jgi:hypothetical protein